jgi:hypothetical protein
MSRDMSDILNAILIMLRMHELVGRRSDGVPTRRFSKNVSSLESAGLSFIIGELDQIDSVLDGIARFH